MKELSRIKRYGITLICSLAVALISLFMKKTIYEFVLYAGLTASIVYFIFWPLLFEKRVGCVSVLAAFSGIAIICSLYFVFTTGQISIDSDTATASILNHCAIKHLNPFPHTWVSGNGEIWTISTATTTLIPSLLLKNESLARMAGSAIYFLIALGGIFFQGKKLFRDRSYLLAIPMMSALLVNSWSVSIIQSAYTGQIIWMSFCTSLFYLIYKEDNKKTKYIHIFIFGALLFVLSMGGIRILAEQTLPVWLAFMVLLWLKQRVLKEADWKGFWKTTGIMTAVAWMPSILGLIAHHYLSITRTINTDTEANEFIFVNSISEVFDNIRISISDLFTVFSYSGGTKLFNIHGFNNFIIFFLCVMICFIIPVLQWITISKEKEEVQFFFIFGMIHNLLMFILAVLFDKNESRYLGTVAFVCVLISARYAYGHWIDQKLPDKYLWTGAFCIAYLISFSAVLSGCVGWHDQLEQKKTALKQLEEEGVTKAYASYWYAYSGSVYSDFTPEFAGVEFHDIGITPFYWLVDSELFIPEADIRTALLLTENEAQILGDRLIADFGEPVEMLKIGNQQACIFDYDIGINFINWLDDNKIVPVELFNGENSVLYNNVDTVYTEGCVFGPAIEMDSGNYQVVFHGKNLDKGDIDVYSNTQLDDINLVETGRSDDTVSFDVTMKKEIPNVEFRVFNHSDEVIELYYIDVLER